MTLDYFMESDSIKPDSKDLENICGISFFALGHLHGHCSKFHSAGHCNKCNFFCNGVCSFNKYPPKDWLFIDLATLKSYLDFLK